LSKEIKEFTAATEVELTMLDINLRGNLKELIGRGWAVVEPHYELWLQDSRSQVKLGQTVIVRVNVIASDVILEEFERFSKTWVIALKAPIPTA
jgi:hypothetical protein